MFKNMKPYFWWGMGLYYGLIFLIMILEMNIPGMTYDFKIGGVPAVYFYTHLLALYILPVFVAWLFWWVPEQQELKGEGQEGKRNAG